MQLRQVLNGKHLQYVRAWNGEEPFFKDGRPLKEPDLNKYRFYGATDIFTNMPERYLNEK